MRVPHEALQALASRCLSLQPPPPTPLPPRSPSCVPAPGRAPPCVAPPSLALSFCFAGSADILPRVAAAGCSPFTRADFHIRMFTSFLHENRLISASSFTALLMVTYTRPYFLDGFWTKMHECASVCTSPPRGPPNDTGLWVSRCGFFSDKCHSPAKHVLSSCCGHTGQFWGPRGDLGFSSLGPAWERARNADSQAPSGRAGPEPAPATRLLGTLHESARLAQLRGARTTVLTAPLKQYVVWFPAFNELRGLRSLRPRESDEDSPPSL